MKLEGRTVLITGGGSGIGRALARRLHRLGNWVVIAGRRAEALDESAAGHPGMETMTFDQADAASVRQLAQRVLDRFPALDTLVNNAGVQRLEDLKAGAVEDAELTYATNLLGPVRLTAALLPALLKRPDAAILNVTSSLAFLPAAMIPSYCASKAAMHSYTQSLRRQLRDTAVRVIEIIPPWVQTELQGERGLNPRAMPLAAFVDEAMALLQHPADADEIVVERARAQRFAERGDYDALYRQFNDGFAAAQSREP